MLEWLQRIRVALLNVLQDLVNIDSNSYDKKGGDDVSVRFIFFNDHQIKYKTSPVDHLGDVIRAVVLGGDGNKPIMLRGHSDTVFQSRKFSDGLFPFLKITHSDLK